MGLWIDEMGAEAEVLRRPTASLIVVQDAPRADVEGYAFLELESKLLFIGDTSQRSDLLR